MISYAYPSELIHDIENAKGFGKKISGWSFTFFRLGALLCILFIFGLCLFFVSIAVTSHEPAIAVLFAVFFFVLGWLAWRAVEAGGTFENVKELVISENGIEMRGDFGIKWKVDAGDIEEIVIAVFAGAAR